MRIMLGALIIAGIAGCAHTLPPVEPRAAFDLGCPQAQLQTVAIDKRTVGVSGCGKKAVYVETCQWTDGYGGKHDCTWVMNTTDAAAPLANATTPPAAAPPAAR